MEGSIGERTGTRLILFIVFLQGLGVIGFVAVLPPAPPQAVIIAVLNGFVTFDGVLIGFGLLLAMSNLDGLQGLLDRGKPPEGEVGNPARREITRRMSNRRTDLTALSSFIFSTLSCLVLIGLSGAGLDRVWLSVPLDFTFPGLWLLLLRLTYYAHST